MIFQRKKESQKEHIQIQNKGIWKRFFHMCKIAHIPYFTLGIYFIANIIQYTVLVYVPQINGDFFNGDASLQSIAMFIGTELLVTFVVQLVVYVDQIFRARTNRNLRNVLWGKILRLKPKYYDKVSASTLLSRITIDTDCLNEFILDIVLAIFSMFIL